MYRYDVHQTGVKYGGYGYSLSRSCDRVCVTVIGCSASILRTRSEYCHLIKTASRVMSGAGKMSCLKDLGITSFPNVYEDEQATD